LLADIDFFKVNFKTLEEHNPTFMSQIYTLFDKLNIKLKIQNAGNRGKIHNKKHNKTKRKTQYKKVKPY
jgi:hypothetical protein